LLEVVSHNLARQMDSVAVYEIGSVFLSQGQNVLPVEKEHLAGAITGLWMSPTWQGEKKPVDFFVAKGILEGMFDLLGLENRVSYVQAKIDGLHPGRTAE